MFCKSWDIILIQHDYGSFFQWLHSHALSLPWGLNVHHITALISMHAAVLVFLSSSCFPLPRSLCGALGLGNGVTETEDAETRQASKLQEECVCLCEEEGSLIGDSLQPHHLQSSLTSKWCLCTGSMPDVVLWLRGRSLHRSRCVRPPLSC